MDKLQKRYGLLTAICMVVGIVIGSGVFFKAQTILQKTGGNMPLGILAWIIGGVIMLTCLLAFSVMAQTAIANGASIMVERVEAALPPFAAAWRKGSVPDAIWQRVRINTGIRALNKKYQ